MGKLHESLHGYSCNHGRAQQRLCKQSEGKKPRCDCYALLFLHCKALVAKTLPAELVPVLDDVVRMVNPVKT